MFNIIDAYKNTKYSLSYRHSILAYINLDIFIKKIANIDNIE